jgi:hypothetical protein
MNCAPITAKAGAAGSRSKDRRLASNRRQQSTTYPDLFLANIGEASNGCDTAEALAQQVAIQYPSPGSKVLTPNGPDGLFKQSCDGNPRNTLEGSGSSTTATGAGAAPSATGPGGAGPAATAGASLGRLDQVPSGSKP